MKTTVIIISVAVLILLLLLSRLRFTFESIDGVNLTLRFLFMKFRLYPKKQKKIRLRDYSLKKVKARKNQDSAEKRRDKKKSSNKSKSVGKADGDAKSFLIACLKTIAKDLPKRVRTERLVLHLTVCGKDAAGTALKFGAANQFASLLCSIIDEGMPMKNTNRRSIRIAPDYTGEKDQYNVKITLSITLGGIILSALKILGAYVSTANAE